MSPLPRFRRALVNINVPQRRDLKPPLTFQVMSYGLCEYQCPATKGFETCGLSADTVLVSTVNINVPQRRDLKRAAGCSLAEQEYQVNINVPQRRDLKRDRHSDVLLVLCGEYQCPATKGFETSGSVLADEPSAW